MIIEHVTIENLNIENADLSNNFGQLGINELAGLTIYRYYVWSNEKATKAHIRSRNKKAVLLP